MRPGGEVSRAPRSRYYPGLNQPLTPPCETPSVRNAEHGITNTTSNALPSKGSKWKLDDFWQCEIIGSMSLERSQSTLTASRRRTSREGSKNQIQNQLSSVFRVAGNGEKAGAAVIGGS